MGARTRYRKRDATPSPNSYTLPSLLGSRVPNKQASSSYSMAGRPITGSFSEDLAKSPGPGRYDTSEIVSNSPKAPAYSMLSRRTKSGGVCVCVCVCVCLYTHGMHAHCWGSHVMHAVHWGLPLAVMYNNVT